LLLKLFQERPPQERVYAEFEALTSQLHDIRIPEGFQLPSERDILKAKFDFLQFDPQKAINLEEEDEPEQPADDEADEQEEEAVDAIDTEDLY